MAKSLACVLLLCLLAFQVDCSRDKRAITLPKINIFDPASSLSSFVNFIKSIADEVTKAVGNAVGVAGQLKTNLDNVVKTVVNATETEVQKLVQGVEATIKDRLANGVVANTVKAGVCAKREVENATAAGKTAVNTSVACITNQVNAFITPVTDLVDKGQRALSLGSNIYQNLTSCFPNGFNVQGLDLIGNLGCAAGKIGPAMAEVSTIVTSITNDVKALQNSFATTRNAIIVCPRERLAALVIQLGDVVTDFGKCMDAIIPDPATAAPAA